MLGSISILIVYWYIENVQTEKNEFKVYITDSFKTNECGKKTFLQIHSKQIFTYFGQNRLEMSKCILSTKFENLYFCKFSQGRRFRVHLTFKTNN